jgi:hypothetical protein
MTGSNWISLAIFAIVYFLPTIVAKLRGADNAAPTFIVNLFLGWTLIGWVVALAMGAGAKKREGQITAQQYSSRTSQAAPQLVTAIPSHAQTGAFASAELERLGELHARGVLTEDEFAAAKGRMLGLPTARP